MSFLMFKKIINYKLRIKQNNCNNNNNINNNNCNNNNNKQLRIKQII